MSVAWSKRIMEWFFPTPKICPICKRPQPALMLCASCQTLLHQKRQNHGQCKRCGTYGVRADRCNNCREWPKYLQGNYAPLPYDGMFRQAILDFKHRSQPWLAAGLADIMVPFVPKEAEVVIPVPLHTNRLRQRGFNQSLLLAQALAQATEMTCLSQVLVRKVDTPHQTGLSRKERFDNLQSAFDVVKPELILGKKILLIDDVLTTGTTIVQCAKVLHQSGGKSIEALTLASGMK